MPERTNRIRALCALAAGLGILAFAAGDDARADDAPADACNAWDVEYVINSTLRIDDTTMGAGDGTWPIGPGRMVVRFENKNGAPGGNAKLMDYSIHGVFAVTASILVSSAVVTADSTAKTTPNACGVSAQGTLTDHTLTWNGPWQGLRSDGTLTCTGGLCGKFGAPPAGQSPLHVAPHPVPYKPFSYSPDFKTFTMPESLSGHQDSPSSTSHVALAGRESKRTCIVAKPCP